MIESILPDEEKKRRFTITYTEHFKEFEFSGSRREIKRKFNLDKNEFEEILKESIEDVIHEDQDNDNDQI